MASVTQHIDTVDELYLYITTGREYETPLSTVEFSTLEELKNKFKKEGVELSVLEENGLYKFKI
ncbi:hypothetical protein [Rahnella selenatireducens]|uniref:hypothetical protein n=1 Tax=Rahnella selenatireducens TaxID=3389797 RepID=UPI003968CBF2